MTKDLKNFNKLSENKQIAEIKRFIKGFPKAEQAALRKDLLGER